MEKLERERCRQKFAALYLRTYSRSQGRFSPCTAWNIDCRAKWDAWEKLKGTGLDAAKQQYIDLIESLS